MESVPESDAVMADDNEPGQLAGELDAQRIQDQNEQRAQAVTDDYGAQFSLPYQSVNALTRNWLVNPGRSLDHRNLRGHGGPSEWQE